MTRLQVCCEPGCPALTDKSRCPEHAREKRREWDADRPNWRERGYTREYDANRLVVLEEEDVCHICGKPVDKTLPGTHRFGPTVDHLTRRADGGSNSRDNLRLAHKSCNSARHGARNRHGPPPPTSTTNECEPRPRVRSVGMN